MLKVQKKVNFGPKIIISPLFGSSFTKNKGWKWKKKTAPRILFLSVIFILWEMLVWCTACLDMFWSLKRNFLFPRYNFKIVFNFTLPFSQCDHEGCNKTFSTIYNLNIHTKLHKQLEYVACEVEGCGEVFPSKVKLEIHQRKHFEDKQIK